MAALTSWVLAGARSQPAAVVFEDLHWADPTTLDLMQALAERAAQALLLIIATMRPGVPPASWSARSQHSVIALSPLDRADVALMVGELAQGHALSQEVVEAVSERNRGGVPLFVEEVTRLLLEPWRGGRASGDPAGTRFSSRSPPGSTGWAKRARLHRSARCWAASFPMRCSPRWAEFVGQELQTAADVRGLGFLGSIGLSTRTSCSSKGPALSRPIASGMR